MTTRTRLVLAVLVVSLGGVLAGQQPAPAEAPAQTPAQPAAPQPPVTFRAEVNYVEVDARVLDANGAFVDGLTAKDFQVLEDGKPQQVTVFSMVNLPVERAQRPLFASKPIEPDVTTNLTGHERARLPDRPRRPAHQRAADAAGARRGPRSSSSASSAPTTWWRSSTPAGGPTPARSSRPTRA